MSAESLTIAQVTPYGWGPINEVNETIARSAAALADRGHRVVVVAPALSRRPLRDARRAIAAAAESSDAIFGPDWDGPRADPGGPAILEVGQGIPVPHGPRPAAAPLPVDVSKALEELFTAVEFDLVHVHDPFAPSTSSAALRQSRSLNVASFHEPTERILSTQLARPIVEIFFGRFDARTVSGAATKELMERYFPGRYELVTPGTRPAADMRSAGARLAGPRIAYVAREERGALRLFVRALRRLSLEPDWSAVIAIEDASIPTPRIARELRERVVFERGEGAREAALSGADIFCATSGGPRTSASSVRSAIAAGAAPLISHIDAYAELLASDDAGLLFPPGDVITLAAQIERLLSDPGARERIIASARTAVGGWDRHADQLEGIYRRICARRHPPEGNPAVQRRLAKRPMVDCDLHMHTDHSNDCATAVEVLVSTAKDRKMGVIAVTDHNEISGAFAARDYAERIGGIKVIVGEEVKTAEQGEVIGLFLDEKIERGMTMAETVAEIRRQGGLVYVPHPFDRLHSVPDYEHLLEMVEEIDIIEVFNPRVAFSGFNEEAQRFASKYRIVPGAGSDGHVAQALGSVRIRMRDFSDPEEFLESMRDADIVRKHKNLVYIQTLKQLQTAGGRGGARRSVAEPRPVKGGQNRPKRRS